MKRGESSGLDSDMITIQERRHDEEDEEEEDCWIGNYVEEAKKQMRLAVPLIAVSMLQYSLQVISIMFNGHLGELPLSGASMGSSFASVTGFTVLVTTAFSSSYSLLIFCFLLHYCRLIFFFFFLVNCNLCIWNSWKA